MSLDTLLSKMNEGEIELLAAELVARLSGEYSSPAARPSDEYSAPRCVSDAPDSDLSTSQYRRERPESESESSELMNLPSGETPTDLRSENRKPSPALEQILSAMKTWNTETLREIRSLDSSPEHTELDSKIQDAEFTPHSNFASENPIYNTNFTDTAERRETYNPEHSNYKSEHSGTNFPAETPLSKVPYNINFTEIEAAGKPENTTTAFSYGENTVAFSHRGDTVPAFRSSMERVSDFFMRDSRRYDSGFERF